MRQLSILVSHEIVEEYLVEVEDDTDLAQVERDYLAFIEGQPCDVVAGAVSLISAWDTGRAGAAKPRPTQERKAG